jgi:protein-L-isoaspartate(D-aspartate) O-methyltransferase
MGEAGRAGEPAASLVEAARRSGVHDPRVLDALQAVPRSAYVPPGQARLAYEDMPVPIPHGQVTTQPSLVARMLEGLALRGVERVLEVGTGYGYQTALLARLAREVWSIERWPDLADAARANLAGGGVDNAHVLVGDGSEGLPEHAPFDAVLVSAAFPQVPPPLAGQLALGGRLVQPIGHGGNEQVVLFENRAGTRLEEAEVLIGAHFVPLYGRHGFPDPRADR